MLIRSERLATKSLFKCKLLSMKELFKDYKRPARKADGVRKAAHIVRDAVLLGDWQEVQGVEATTIKPDLSPEVLNGLIIKGYEMKFNATNENGERYDKTAFDEFIQSYFVDRKLNMPVDINHQGYRDWHAYCGRVLYIETNGVGFYFAVYVPKSYPEYDRLLWALKSGIIQGFSKEGFVGYDDFDWVYNEDGTFDHEQIHKMKVLSVSLVTTPANGIPFEQMKQTQNALVFENKTEKKGKTLAEFFG